MKNIPIRIIYEDQYIIVIEKREGLLSMGTAKGKEEITAHSLLNNYIRNTAPRRGRYAPQPRIFIVHRLDRETSGLMVFAKSEEIKRTLQDNWDEIVTQRKYVAVVNGCYEQEPNGNTKTQGNPQKQQQQPQVQQQQPQAQQQQPQVQQQQPQVQQQQPAEPVQGTIRSWLKENSAYIVYSSPKDNGGQLAITHYKVLDSNPKTRKSLMELELETGRKNQIRVHMQEMGTPIFGDKKYYGGIQSHLEESKKAHRLYLHAFTLNFIHPVTGKEMKFTTGIPRSFISTVEKPVPVGTKQHSSVPQTKQNSNRGTKKHPGVPQQRKK